MQIWHRTLAAHLGLRIGGALLLAVGWSAAVRLHHMALVTSAREATSFMMVLAAAIFACGSAGSVLLFVGPGLWERVEVSERWRRPPGAPAFHPSAAIGAYEKDDRGGAGDQ